MKAIFENITRSALRGSLLLAMAALMGSASAAPTTAYEFTFNSGQLVNASDYSAGFEFVIGASNLSLQSLGYYAYGGGTTNTPASFITSAHDVGIWDVAASGTLLRSVSITTADTQSGNFFYEAVAPLTLLATHTYRIAGASGTGADARLPSPLNGTPTSYVDFSQGSGFTINGGVINSGTALAYPGIGPNGGATDFYGTVDFQYSAVPEPGSAMLLVAGAAGGLFTILFRRRKV